MSVYYKFADHDILYSVVNTSPKTIAASGTTGWRANTGASASLSLYEGLRSRRDLGPDLDIYPLDQVDTHSIDKVVFVSGSYPSTGSISFAKCRKAPIDPDTPSNLQITSNDWYQEHFSPIELLYKHYEKINPEYFTGSYDYYSIYIHSNDDWQASSIMFSGNLLSTVEASATFEAQIKPLAISGLGRDFTIQSQFQKFKFYITGSDAKLAFSDYTTVVTSSSPVLLGVWQGVAVAIGGGSASFYINGALDSMVDFTGALSTQTGSFLRVGAEHVLSGSDASSSLHNGFDGFVFDTRTWDVKRTTSQISASWNSTLFASGSTSLVHYARFNDGPLSMRHGKTKGSGTFDYSVSAAHGEFDDGAWPSIYPFWQPNDNQAFTTWKTRINDEITMLRVLHVPSMFYGRQIATGSVNLVCNAYSEQGVRRVLLDDGRGLLFVSGSLCQPVGGDSRSGVQWRKVGNVFYTEGLVVITEPSLLDFGDTDRRTDDPQDCLQVNFRGLERISTKVFMCRVGAAEANTSNNPTYTRLDETSGKLEFVRDDSTTYVTAVGLYDENRRLVAVAKLAQPIRKREKDKLNIRLRFDI